MEDNFRNSLIIISAVVIGAIFVHGLWTIRKNKNPYKLKASKDKVKPIERNFDHGGFDQDGVGKPIVKSQTNKSELDQHSAEDNKASDSFSAQAPSSLDNEKHKSEQLTPEVDSSDIPSFDAFEKTMEEISANDHKQPTQADEIIAAPLDETAINLTHSTSIENDKPLSENPESLNAQYPNTAPDELNDKLASKKEVVLEEVVTQKPLYSQPVSRPKPRKNTPTKAELKRNQIEINFENTASEDKQSKVSAQEENNEQQKVQPEVLSLSVVMPQNQIMQGATLLPMLLTLGLKYGEMNIFHRHQDNAGNGPVTFSLANMVNPGSFELETIETFVTQGITLFMMLPNAGNAFDVYQQMLSAAKQLSEEFNAQILDDKRNIMTKQTEQHYVSRIRDFEIKNRTAQG